MMFLTRYRRTWIFLATIIVLVVIFGVSQLLVRAATYPIIVDGDSDASLAVLGTNATCDLREAIAAANSYTTVGQCVLPGGLTSADDFLITFDAAVTLISLQTELPQITATVEIQGGGTVTLEEATGQTVAYGLYFTEVDAVFNSDNSIVTGMTIQGFTRGIVVDNVANLQIGDAGAGNENEIVNNRDGILVTGVDAVTTVIENNYIGVDLPIALNGNTRYGIHVTGDASRTRILSNVIAGNGAFGIYNQSADYTVIGDGTLAGGNDFVALGTGNDNTAIYVVDSDFVNINLNNIDASGAYGIYLNGSNNADIQNNLIGATGNGADGIFVLGGSNDVRIANNTIINNGGAGVRVINFTTQALIEDNTFSNNDGLGIDLGTSGVNPNDNGDGDSGPNGLQNYPVLTMVATDGANTYIQGNFSAQAGVYDFIYYVNNDCDIPSGYGEGETILGTTGQSPGAFSDVLGSTTAGQYLTVIAINQTGASAGDTSEFSRCFLIQDATLIVDFTPLNSIGSVGQTINFTNLSSGLITGYVWTVYDSLNNPIGTDTTTDFSFTFPAVDVYTVELCATDVTPTTQCVTGTVTIQAATATPTPTNTPIPPPPPADTATHTPTGSPTSTLTQTSTSTLTSTATQTQTSTSTLTSTATLTQTSTSTLTSTATLTQTQTSTSTLTSTATQTQTSTSTLTSTVTQTATGTTTPDIDVTVEDLSDTSVGINIFNGSDFAVEDVGLVIDPRSAVYSSTTGSFECIETGGVFSCFVSDIGPSEFATQVVNCPDENNVNCSAVQVGVDVGGVGVTVVDEPYIIKVSDPPIAVPGTEILYTVRLINPLGETVTGITITDQMPAVMRIIDSDADKGTITIVGQDITYELDELGAGESIRFTITTEVRDDLVYNYIVNEACVSSSANPNERCASVSFIRTEGLPATGEIHFMVRVLRWIIVPVISGLMLLGIGLFFKKLRRSA